MHQLVKTCVRSMSRNAKITVPPFQCLLARRNGDNLEDTAAST